MSSAALSMSRIADYLDPPAQQSIKGWIQDRLGEFLWSKQRDICDSVEQYRYTAVPSAHGTGKSFIASRIAAAWIETNPPGEAFVVTTAPTDKQVKMILWREIGRAHRKGNLRGRINLDAEWYIGPEPVAYGRKPADYTDPNHAMQAFQGIHAKRVLVLMDEACGIPPWLWTAVDSLVTNNLARVLAIGNPDDPASQFEKVCRPGSGWNVLPISAFDLPAFTGEYVPEEMLDLLTGSTWVEERAKRWGAESPLYISKVLGQFPEVSDDTLITPAMIREAITRKVSGIELGQMGADVARLGTDRTVVYHNRGGRVRKLLETHKTTTDKTMGRFAMLLQKFKQRVPMSIDSIGIGAGVYDKLRADGHNVQPFVASEKAINPKRYLNKRAEAYWTMREWFEEGLVDIDEADEDLQAQLGVVKWWPDSSGRVVIESKDDMKKRGLPSPDHADACVMSFVAPAEVYIPDISETIPDLTSDLLTRAM